MLNRPRNVPCMTQHLLTVCTPSVWSWPGARRCPGGPLWWRPGCHGGPAAVVVHLPALQVMNPVPKCACSCCVRIMLPLLMPPCSSTQPEAPCCSPAASSASPFAVLLVARAALGLAQSCIMPCAATIAGKQCLATEKRWQRLQGALGSMLCCCLVSRVLQCLAQLPDEQVHPTACLQHAGFQLRCVGASRASSTAASVSAPFWG